MNNNNSEKLEQDLAQLYGKEAATQLMKKLWSITSVQLSKRNKPRISHNDAMLICYADSIVSTSHESPLQALKAFIDKHSLQKTFPQTHLLPFFPWDTDRGFSVKDFYQVDPRNGSWSDISSLSNSTELMFDFVANHASIENPLVQAALIARHVSKEHSSYSEMIQYKDFVIAYSEDNSPRGEDLDRLARPRANPVLTPYVVGEDKDGELFAFLGSIEKDAPSDCCKVLGTGLVWTTFSRGCDNNGMETTRQVDLNFRNPEVFLEAIRILSEYSNQGAQFVRLDAIGYLWKKLGSSSLHETETHQLINCLQQAVEMLEFNIVTVAEINEPQSNIIPYLGTDEKPEADLVYQFTHFPLAIHAIIYQTSEHYLQWLESLSTIGGRQFVTVLGSHDGLGMKPLRGILPESEIQLLASELVEQHQGLPNYAILPGGEKIIYEVCATPWVLVNGVACEDSMELQIARYTTVVKMGLLARGLPGFYINGVIASENYLPLEGIDENRSINREQFELNRIDQLISSDSHHKAVYEDIRQCLLIRGNESAFDPLGPPVRPIHISASTALVVELPATEASQTLLSIHNLRPQEQLVVIERRKLQSSALEFDNLLGKQLDIQMSDKMMSIKLAPYETVWLKQT